MTIAPETYANRPVGKAYISAILSILTTACGILVAFMWRDIIIGILKKYNYYDCENGFKKEGGIFWAIAIVIFLTFLAAALLVFTVKTDKNFLN